MHEEIGLPSLKELMKQAVPSNILHNQKVLQSQAKVLGESSSEGTTLATRFLKTILEWDLILL